MKHLLFLLILSAGAASAASVPDACVKCRFVYGISEYKACLAECMPAEHRPRQHNGKRWVQAKAAGWHLREESSVFPSERLRIASKSADNSFEYMMDWVRPELLIMQHPNGRLQAAVSFAPAKVLGAFSGDIAVRIDKERAMRPNVQSIRQNTALAFDANGLERALRDGRKLYFETEIFGSGRQTFVFDLTGSESAISWTQSR